MFEALIMFLTHMLKSAEYFIVEGFPEISAEQLPYLAEALIYYISKLLEIYLSGFT